MIKKTKTINILISKSILVFFVIGFFIQIQAQPLYTKNKTDKLNKLSALYRNNERKKSTYKLIDFYDYNLSLEMFMYYANDEDFETVARNWNGGPEGHNRKATLNYWKLIQKAL